MAFSVGKIISDIVDWTHEEIVALEAHLGMHPNRKPTEPAPPVVREIPADMDAATTEIERLQKYAADLEDEVKAANAKVFDVEAQLKAAEEASTAELARLGDLLAAATTPAETPPNALPGCDNCVVTVDPDGTRTHAPDCPVAPAQVFAAAPTEGPSDGQAQSQG